MIIIILNPNLGRFSVIANFYYLTSPFLPFRVRTETCQQLKQLLYLSMGQHHQSASMMSGVEPCCYLFAWKTSDSSRPPPYAFESISLQNVNKSPYIDLLLDILFRSPRDSTNLSHSSPLSAKALLSPFWTTNQLRTLMDNEERQTILHCAEFFRLRGWLFGLVDKDCLEAYAGQDHVAIFEVSCSFLHFAMVVLHRTASI